MIFLKDVFILFLCVGLVSCTPQNKTGEPNRLNQNVVLLELDITNVKKDNYIKLNNTEGVLVVYRDASKMLLKIDSSQLEVKNLNKLLISNGIKIVRKQNVENDNSVITQIAKNNIEPRIQIPEFTFPNIFKALVVFYK